MQGRKEPKVVLIFVAYKPGRIDKTALGNTENWLIEANENHISPPFMYLLGIIYSLQIQEHFIYIKNFPSAVSSVIFFNYICKDPTHNSP